MESSATSATADGCDRAVLDAASKDTRTYDTTQVHEQVPVDRTTYPRRQPPPAPTMASEAKVYEATYKDGTVLASSAECRELRAATDVGVAHAIIMSHGPQPRPRSHSAVLVPCHAFCTAPCTEPTEIVEGNPYFPPSAVKTDLFKGSDYHTTCGCECQASQRRCQSA